MSVVRIKKRNFRKGIPFKFPAFFQEALEKLRSAGFREPVLRGGALRDLYMGEGSFDDLDIRIWGATTENAQKFLNDLENLTHGNHEPPASCRDFLLEQMGVFLCEIERKKNGDIDRANFICLDKRMIPTLII